MSERFPEEYTLYTYGISYKETGDGVCWSPKGTMLLVFGGIGVQVYDAATWKQLHKFNDPNFYCGDCRISPDEKCIASAGASKAVTIRKLPSLEICHTFQEKGFTAALCFDDKGERIAFRYPHPPVCLLGWLPAA